MKRSIVIVVAAALVLALAGIAWASDASTEPKAAAAPVEQSVSSASVSSQVYFVIGQSSYSVNGVVYNTDAAPFINEDGRTFVPVRYFGDSIGAKTDWDGATSTVTLTKGDVAVKLTIDSKSILVNDQASTIDVAPLIKDGRTYIQAQYVAEAFGYTVGWDQVSQTVSFK